MALYVLFDTRIGKFRVLAVNSTSISRLSQRKTKAGIGGTLKDVEGVHTAAVDRWVNRGDALRYVTSFMFDLLFSLFLNFKLYSESRK